MSGGEAMEHILRALRARLREQWGRIAEIESRIGKSRGYLSRTLRRSWPLPLDVLLTTLDVLGVDAGDFFGQALDVASSPDAWLAEIEAEAPARPAAPSPAGRFDAAVGTAAAPCSADEAAALVRELTLLPPAEQKRRLRGRRFRRAGFAAAYLDELDALRYERPREAEGLAACLLHELLPQLPARANSEEEPRQALVCRAFGVLGSCQRLRGDVALAAGTIRRGLAEARRHGLKEVTAELLQRGAYVLSDRGRYRRALELVREAFEIYSDRNLAFALARSLVDRGILMGYAGADGEAVEILGRAYRELPKDPASVALGARGALGRNREAVYHHLAMAHAARGETGAAERWLGEARRTLGNDRRVQARLSWQRGRLLLLRGESHEAERALRRALKAFEEDRETSAELVRLDLLQALVGLGRRGEAVRLADEQASLARLRHRADVGDAFERLARAGRAGLMTLRRIRSEADAFHKRRWPASLRPRRGDASR